MKLLLTSNGLSNDSIAQALFNLVGKDPKDTILSFIPTSMNIESGDKSWFINDLQNFKKQGFKEIDIVDISALPQKIWQPRLEKADVLFFSGGNTMHLMYWIHQSGLKDILPELLKTRVYAGISAGSMVTNPDITLGTNDQKIYYEEDCNYTSEEGLSFINFYTRPHFNSKSFPKASKEYIQKIADETGKTIYALDDQSAIKINGENIEIISEGEWKKFN